MAPPCLSGTLTGRAAAALSKGSSLRALGRSAAGPHSPWSMECCGSWLSWLLTTPA